MPRTKQPAKKKPAPFETTKADTLKAFYTGLTKVEKVHDKWMADEREDVGPPREYVKLQIDWLLTLDGAIPPELYPHLNRIEDYAELWATRLEQSRWNRLPLSRILFIAERFASLRELLARSKENPDPPPKKPLESVWQLHQEKVGAQQIAVMHGLSVDQVWAEIKVPGSICKEDYIPPSVLAEQAEAAEAKNELNLATVTSGTRLSIALAKLRQLQEELDNDVAIGDDEELDT
jgi:hypothetical protein